MRWHKKDIHLVFDSHNKIWTLFHRRHGFATVGFCERTNAIHLKRLIVTRVVTREQEREMYELGFDKAIPTDIMDA